MLTNYFKSTWRNLWKDRSYTILNIAGLALSTAVFLLMISYVRFENSYEDFNPLAKNIYRITYDYYNGSEYQLTDCETHRPLGPLVKQEIPEVRDYVRAEMMEDDNDIKVNNQIFHVTRTYAVDPSFFHFFPNKIVKGDISNFAKPFQVVLTETQAKRIFGNQDPIGKVVSQEENLYTVIAVMSDSPANTHFKVDMLYSFSSLEAMGWETDSWNGNNNYLYVELEPHASLKAFNTKLDHLSRVTLKGKISDNNLFQAEPISTIHLHSHKSWEPEVNGDANTVRFLLISACLILLVGSVNYINLTTARAAERIKEVGMRKLLGSSRSRLIRQLLSETLLTNLVALLLAIATARVALPFYRQLVEKPREINWFNTPAFWELCVALLLFNIVISGVYPAFSLSAIKPIKVVGRTFTGGKAGNLLRRILVVGQFGIAIIVLSATFIVYQQLNFMHRQDLGLNPTQVLVVNGPNNLADSVADQLNQSFKQRLMQLGQVKEVSISDAVPGGDAYELSTANGISIYGSKDGRGHNYSLYGIDEDFIGVNGMHLLAGRNFDQGKNAGLVIINESAAHLLGFKNSADAVEQRITWGMPYATIVGVMKDFHQLSLKQATLPMIHWYSNGGNFYSIKLQTKDIGKTIHTIEQLWKEQFPGYAFQYNFLDALFDQQYAADLQFGKVVGIFSGITLFIACMGVFGLVSYTISKRIKEIGIRKVLGASMVEIVRLLSTDFLRLILIALIVATPIAWYLMNDWLNDFAYRTAIHIWPFLMVGIITLALAFFVLSLQSIKAASMNPVNSLRSE